MKTFVLASLAALAVVSLASADVFNGAYAGLGATLDNVNGSGSLEGFGASGAGLTGFVAMTCRWAAHSSAWKAISTSTPLTRPGSKPSGLGRERARRFQDQRRDGPLRPVGYQATRSAAAA
ncbi:hypothetical protein SmB9_38090 [Sphingosinicella microcystinivorans]|uniref:Uncharacterized protein n=1 Tax=Sphingosinicella microcystinivorans TaxID=335406 RepID=A0AAD1DCS0_SPHMI|nr:hypothetical protein [Sphingosinicella microcystinivorans]BBE36151.1 hypothetical protein SmB9_38090 [Sphingosinicella microcystinivorans]